MDSYIAKDWIKYTFAASIEKSRESVLFLDNLNCQTTKEFHELCREEANCIVYPLPPNETDKIQPVGAGESFMNKKLIGGRLDRYLEDDDNFEKWRGVGYSASERGILLTKWVGEPYKEAGKFKNFRKKLFQKTGLLMTAVAGEEDSLIKPQGFENYSF
eukprot:gene10404-11491_t